MEIQYPNINSYILLINYMTIFQHILSKKNIDTIIYENFPTLKIDVYKNKKSMGKIICEINKKSKSIKICDIYSDKKNRGYGSIMMQNLIEYGKKNDFIYIDGWLSRVDYGHKERLLHFYQKFGFKVTPCNENIKFANIKLDLRIL